MRDLQKDWIKWTRAERFSALLILAVLTIGAPSLLMSKINSVAGGHNSNPIERSL
jgi:hypothetical protein